METSFEELEILVRQWADERGLIKRENVYKQTLKFFEEAGELASGINKNNNDKIIDGFGDVLVTLIIAAAQLDLNLTECLEVAYEEIKNREGETINGVFVKKQDL